MAHQQLRRAGYLRRCGCHPITLDTRLDTVKVLPHEQLFLLDQARVQRRGAPVATSSRHEDVRRHLITPHSPRPLLPESRVLVRRHSLHHANLVSCVQDVTCLLRLRTWSVLLSQLILHSSPLTHDALPLLFGDILDRRDVKPL